jgi:3-isopropylmalate/(R)-2-methylmalate dehydratase small subunit
VRGRAFVFGDGIDTDALAPGRMMKRPLAELASACLESVDATFAGRVRPGDVVVAGRAFGIGSSREQAAEGLKYLGVSHVLAKSFARIFFRNAINLGLPAIICPYADEVSPGDLLFVDAAAGLVINDSNGKRYEVEPLPARLVRMIEDGGLTPHLKRRFAENKT